MAGASITLTKNSFGKSPLKVSPAGVTNALIGLYEVDVGLRQPLLPEEAGTNLMAFADLNSDKYTDIVTVSDSKQSFTVHFYEPLKKMFVYQKTVKPNKDCAQIINVVVGRSVDRIRLFVTCMNPAIGPQAAFTNVKVYEKIPKTSEFIEASFSLLIEHGS
jgi:hypothetical protein